ncbi:uncharacterized protein DUF1566 [Thiocapsa rosea]|uniref:Uncharacterized protein DUF1566 n=2 Tax=Thiocapsa rosea TaxID=69360 RepID=A0A495VG32_9GAMM|nr:uncharacterized protein DUF1566 [Thiocapsa rosea]
MNTKFRSYRASATIATSIIFAIAFGSADAALRSCGSGMIYDEEFDLTWLQDANYAQTSGYDSDGLMTWGEAAAWADQLEFAGFSDWRLPSATNRDASVICPNKSYSCNQSEMGHLWYALGGPNLQNVPATCTPRQTCDDASGMYINLSDELNVFFINMQNDNYWLGTEFDENRAYGFNTGRFFDQPPQESFGGRQGYGLKTSQFLSYAWAVRDGDSCPPPPTSTPIPTIGPAMGIIIGVALAGLARRELRSRVRPSKVSDSETKHTDA